MGMTDAGSKWVNGLYHVRNVLETPHPWEHLYGEDPQYFPWFENDNGCCIIWNHRDQRWSCLSLGGVIFYETEKRGRGSYPTGIYGPPVGSPDSTGWTPHKVQGCPNGADPAPTFDLMPDLM